MKKSKGVTKKVSVNSNYRLEHKGKYLYLIKSNGKVKAKKLYNEKTYSEDVSNAKYHQSFKQHKKETNYGKVITWRYSKRSQKFYNYSKGEEKPKHISQKTISSKEYFIVYCEGYLKHNGHRYNISASSHRYLVHGGTTTEEAREEATENFYRLSYGRLIGTVSDEPPENVNIEDKATIERYYVSYKDKDF